MGRWGRFLLPLINMQETPQSHVALGWVKSSQLPAAELHCQYCSVCNAKNAGWGVSQFCHWVSWQILSRSEEAPKVSQESSSWKLAWEFQLICGDKCVQEEDSSSQEGYFYKQEVYLPTRFNLASHLVVSWKCVIKKKTINEFLVRHCKDQSHGKWHLRDPKLLCVGFWLEMTLPSLVGFLSRVLTFRSESCH